MVTEWLLQCMKLNLKVTSLNDYDPGFFEKNMESLEHNSA